MTTLSRLDYQVSQTTTKKFGLKNYVRVQLENINCDNGMPLTLRIGDMPSIPLTEQQRQHITIALQMDETTLQVLQLLEKQVIHGDIEVRKNLTKLFEV